MPGNKVGPASRDEALGRWLGWNAYTDSMPWMPPYNAMATNPVMCVDPDGNEQLSLLVLGTAALVGEALTCGAMRIK